LSPFAWAREDALYSYSERAKGSKKEKEVRSKEGTSKAQKTGEGKGNGTKMILRPTNGSPSRLGNGEGIAEKKN